MKFVIEARKTSRNSTTISIHSDGDGDEIWNGVMDAHQLVGTMPYQALVRAMADVKNTKAMRDYSYDLALNGFISPQTIMEVVSHFTIFLVGQSIVQLVRKKAKEGIQKYVELEEIFRKQTLREDRPPMLDNEMVRKAADTDTIEDFTMKATGEIFIAMARSPQIRPMIHAFIDHLAVVDLDELADSDDEALMEAYEVMDKPWLDYYPSHDFDADRMRAFVSMLGAVTEVPEDYNKIQDGNADEGGAKGLLELLKSLTDMGASTIVAKGGPDGFETLTLEEMLSQLERSVGDENEEDDEEKDEEPPADKWEWIDLD